MKKFLTVFLFCFVLFSLQTFAQKKSSKKSTTVKKAKKSATTKQPVVCTLPPSVQAVEVSRKEVVFCPSPNDSCSKDSIIEVKTIAMDNGKNNYLYVVTGGKIIGSGALVKWDLTGVSPGTYTITVAIDDYGPTQTKLVTVIK